MALAPHSKRTVAFVTNTGAASLNTNTALSAGSMRTFIQRL
jgi:hypothetical protein